MRRARRMGTGEKVILGIFAAVAYMKRGTLRVRYEGEKAKQSYLTTMALMAKAGKSGDMPNTEEWANMSPEQRMIYTNDAKWTIKIAHERYLKTVADNREQERLARIAEQERLTAIYLEERRAAVAAGTASGDVAKETRTTAAQRTVRTGGAAR